MSLRRVETDVDGLLVVPEDEDARIVKVLEMEGVIEEVDWFATYVSFLSKDFISPSYCPMTISEIGSQVQPSTHSTAEGEKSLRALGTYLCLRSGTRLVIVILASSASPSKN